MIRPENRRWPHGAEVCGDAVSFRVWAPRRQRVTLKLEGTEDGGSIELPPEPGGWFSIVTDRARAGSRYRYQLDDDPVLYPDPASRFQPQGPHGPSEVVDAEAFDWTDDGWRGVSPNGQVVYELHIGTFTAQGTWEAAAEKLPWLVETGVTVLEVMPVAEFSGQFGWGYDGVDLFSPTRLYGSPDDFRRFVDRAHAAGLGVILDVVYNHFGPDGNYVAAYSPHFFTDRYANEWGEAINFDGEQSEPVREFVCSNAAYWIAEFHLDGLRLDATQSIHDTSASHILADLTTAAREAAHGRSLLIVAENEPQDIRHVEPIAEGGFGIDGLWNDDFHHTAKVALTGHSDAYYSDYRGTPQEFISAVKWGYLFQGQWYRWQKKPRGTASLHVPPSQFVTFLENHDQVANTVFGERLHQLASPGRYRALTALLLLAPGTPMLFQGQEFASSRPFLYFADHSPELAVLVAEGRREFLKQFPTYATPTAQEQIPDPASRQTFEQCRLDWEEAETNAEAVSLHRDLLALRRDDPVISRQPRDIDGAVLSSEAFALRYFADDGLDRLLLINLGRDLSLSPIPEPLLAPPYQMQWEPVWSSEDLRYGGSGAPAWEWNEKCTLLAESAVVMVSRPMDEESSSVKTEGNETERQ